MKQNKVFPSKQLLLKCQEFSHPATLALPDVLSECYQLIFDISCIPLICLMMKCILWYNFMHLFHIFWVTDIQNKGHVQQSFCEAWSLLYLLFSSISRGICPSIVTMSSLISFGCNLFFIQICYPPILLCRFVIFAPRCCISYFIFLGSLSHLLKSSKIIISIFKKLLSSSLAAQAYCARLLHPSSQVPFWPRRWISMGDEIDWCGVLPRGYYKPLIPSHGFELIKEHYPHYEGAVLGKIVWPLSHLLDYLLDRLLV